MKIEECIWSEKYRPKKIEQVVLNDRDLQDFRKYINTGEVPNLIFHGIQGSGKTTLARILISEIVHNQKDDVLVINGSAKTTRGIGFVDDTIEPFLRIPPSSGDKFRVVFIDEADYLTDQAFHSLRGIIEKYIKSGRFILTCNYVSKIPDALMSRLTEYKFKMLPKEQVVAFCKHVLDSEKVEYKDEDLDWIISVFYPDIRKTIAEMQKSVVDNKLQIRRNELEISTEKSVVASAIAIIEELKKGQISGVNSYINSITTKLLNEELDYRTIYVDLFNRSQVPPTLKIIDNKYANSHTDCLVPEMHFLAMIFEMIKALREYTKLKK